MAVAEGVEEGLGQGLWVGEERSCGANLQPGCGQEEREQHGQLAKV
jgi:hypothetical protein